MNKIALKINQRELDFTFGLGFLGEALEVLDTDIEGVLLKVNKNPFKTVPILMFQSAKYSLELDGKEVDFTLADMVEWIEKDGALTDKNKSVISFLSSFTNSLLKDIPVNDAEVVDPNESKKK